MIFSTRLLVSALALASSAVFAQSNETLSDAEFARCLADLRPSALKQGLSSDAYARLTTDLRADLSVLPLLNHQPEFKTPIWDYMAGLVDEERIADGQHNQQRWHSVLAEISARYKVDPATVVAIWGVESNYGQVTGKRDLLTSLSTLSCVGRRQSFFRGEFLTALQIVAAGHISREQMRGSWAGAFGQTQFMPSTFMRIAVDFDGDGRRDLVNSVPDALASTANYLKQAGWRNDEPWGYEVRLPPGLDTSGAGRRNKQPLSYWHSRGVVLADGSPLPTQGPNAGLLLPAGVEGPAFLVLRNFDALYSYNAAESYALAIAHLADRLRGGSAFRTPWPTDDAGLSRAERREVQTRLTLLGYDVGEADGIIGEQTRAAIRSFMRGIGEDSDGRAGQKVLARLRERS